MYNYICVINIYTHTHNVRGQNNKTKQVFSRITYLFSDVVIARQVFNKLYRKEMGAIDGY